MNWYKEIKLAKKPFRERARDFGMGAGLGLGVGLSITPNPKPNYYDLTVDQPVASQELQEDEKSNKEQNSIDNKIPNTAPPITDPQINQNQETKQFDLSEESLDLIADHEGLMLRRYFDTEGIPTIGYGFNLNRPDARQQIEALGLNFDRIYNGQSSLTQEQAYQLLRITAQEAEAIARRLFSDINEHPKSVQIVLTDMAFNLGPNRLADFEKMKKALDKRDYDEAANEMVDSKWYKQTKRRAKRLVNMVRNEAI